MFKPIADRSNVTAYVILNRNDVHVANVQFLYGSGGTVYCEAHQFGDATARSLATAIKNNRVSAKHVERIESCANYCSTPESKRRYAER